VFPSVLKQEYGSSWQNLLVPSVLPQKWQLQVLSVRMSAERRSELLNCIHLHDAAVVCWHI